ncbi:hypothetical protein MRX96_016118 [Rhipicephalus microplus]
MPAFPINVRAHTIPQHLSSRRPSSWCFRFLLGSRHSFADCHQKRTEQTTLRDPSSDPRNPSPTAARRASTRVYARQIPLFMPYTRRPVGSPINAAAKLESIRARTFVINHGGKQPCKLPPRFRLSMGLLGVATVPPSAASHN